MSASSEISKDIINALKSVWGDNGQVPLHAPTFGGNEQKYVQDTIDSTFVSSVGQYVDRFEEMIEDYTGIKRAVAVVNGTSALHMALLLVGVSPEDEVLIPALTFVATANAVSYCGAVPHFVDIEEKTLGMDTNKLDDYLKDIVSMDQGIPVNRNTGRPIRAVVPMHTFGHPVKMDVLLETAEKYKIQVVEDAAESLGSFYHGRHTGSFGKVSILSFNGNKIVTTGGGGAIVTNDTKLADQAKYLTTTAKRPHKWEYFHDQIGYNYRLPNLNAALGCAQMEQLSGFVQKKRALAEKYEQVLSKINGVRFFKEPEHAKSNYWFNTLILDEENTHIRDDLLDALNQSGFMARPAWSLMQQLPMFAQAPRMNLENALDLEMRLINIPSSVPD